MTLWSQESHMYRKLECLHYRATLRTTSKNNTPKCFLTMGQISQWPKSGTPQLYKEID